MKTFRFLLGFLMITFVACNNGEGGSISSSQESEQEVEIKSEGIKLPMECNWVKVKPYDPVSYIGINTNFWGAPSYVEYDGSWFLLEHVNREGEGGGKIFLFIANGNRLYHFLHHKYISGDDKYHECGRIELAKNGDIVISDFAEERFNGVYKQRNKI